MFGDDVTTSRRVELIAYRDGKQEGLPRVEQHEIEVNTRYDHFRSE